ncbi:MAG: hypothetical protein ABIA76_05540 [Candidatus Diapherotrites archaeon]
MNSKIILLVLITFNLILSGCFLSPPGPEPTELPEDFKVSYDSGAMHLEWGSSEFHADASGEAYFLDKIGMDLVLRYEFEVTKEELLKIYKVAVANNFFLLMDQSDPSIMDGGWDRISITADGQSKTVNMHNASNDQFSAVETAIYELISSKAPQAYAYNTFENACPKKEIECRELQEQGNECEEDNWDCLELFYACDEWEMYCEERGLTWMKETDLNQETEITAEYCDELENREECIDYCAENDCSEELCDALMFEASECTECSAGCCSYCTELDSCEITSGCEVIWVHPSGESWQFGGCANTNLCETDAELCEYISYAYQGYAYHASIEENESDANTYMEISEMYQELYNEECGEE